MNRRRKLVRLAIGNKRFLDLTGIQCNITITLIPKNCKLFNIIL